MRLPFRVMRGAVQEVFKSAGPRAVPAETELTRIVRRGSQAGNGRSHLATRSEIERRLTEDGIPFAREALETVLTVMFQDGRLGQTDDAEFYTADYCPLVVRGKPEPAPTWAEIEAHTGWEPWTGEMHGRGGGWLEVPYPSG